MKTKLLSLALLASSLASAQQTFSEVTIQNYSPILYLKRDTNDGGFIRGIQTQYLNGDNGWFFGDLHGTRWVVSKGDYQNSKFTIVDNGNVGIGTTNPESKLEIYGGGDLTLKGATEDAGDLIFQQNTGKQNGRVWSNDNGGLYFSGSDNNPKLTLTDNGNAFLAGKFEAKEIKVTLTPTADFVFEDSYQLPNLESVEKHIKEKKHLPEIASAEEMKKNGVNIGDFQIKLLQKIEELTLYSIEQHKLNKELLRMIENQQGKIRELEKHIK